MNRAIQTSLADHRACIAAIEEQFGEIEQIAATTAQALAAGGRLYVAGNGGSAADAQHIAAELVGRFKRERRGLPAVALTTDTSSLTSIGNDYGFERVFARQIEAYVRRGDIVWLLSTSGKSPNMLRAAQAARQLEAITIAFTGPAGSPLQALCDHAVTVPHRDSDRIQEAHQLTYHILCDLIERHFAPGADSAGK
jgi:D-sedoheptulose 7-phosphate isomerase